MKMPLNIRAKPSQNKLSVASKGSGHTDGSASHSRFSRSTKQGKGKQTKVISTPGCRSGLEPGSVSGGLSAQVSKKPVGEGSVSRAGPKKLVVVTDKRDTPDLVATPVSKTLSMENIQSLNAAYGTSSNMYPCERETLEPVGSYPVGTMTVGRNTSHSYSGRATGMGSSPNINSIELNHLSNHYGDQTFRSAGTCSLQRHLSGTHPPTQDLVGQLAPSDLHVQLRELQRENDNLRRELDVGKNGRIGHSMNNVNFCSPDVKRDKGIRREQGARTSALKDFYRDQDQDTIQDTKISSLERNIRDLEDEVQMLKTSSLLYPDDRQDELKQVEVYKSHSKFMKSKEQASSPSVSSIRPAPTFLLPTQQPWITEQAEIEQLKQELNRKESEMQALQTKLETLTNQNSDCKQHIEVLKESLNAKEQRANTLQTEVDALRVRLEEKEQFLSKKNKQLQDLTDEKSTLTGEIRDMKDMLDVKERKVNVLQKKIENLLEQLKDKDKQLTGLRDRVQGLQTDSSNTDTALATLEEALSEKERVIENLREQKERVDRVQLEELERMRKENQELKDKLSAIQPQKLSPSQPATPGMNQSPRPDGEVPSKIDVLPVVSASSTAQNTESALRKCPDITDRLRLLEQEVARYREESGKSQAEVERLMGALRDAEVDRSCKEKRINDLERHIKAPHIQKQTVPGELRKDAQTDGQPHSLSQLEDLMGALEKTRQELDSYKLRLCSTQQTLHERDGHLNSLRQERRKQLEEILEMKQQALLAAISEKDANIALLELSSSKRRKAQEEVMALKREKDRLMHQLKQQTQSRMKMMVDNYEEDRIHQQHHPNHPLRLHSTNVHHRSLPRGPPHANHRPPMDQDDEEGIWA
ncbi:ERC protein 2-like isoform X7 [Dunckerocampus dactyliophorus]|uniref:ERC protein 2-like isoform X7 n=1 Tax=Dunckerocampus dactyliophorus TaxID=161453 RepID=UPI002407564D|nr:ERC protein 2-like isoform X7 [Dunckerocampus dactyliophorus]